MSALHPARLPTILHFSFDILVLHLRTFYVPSPGTLVSKESVERILLLTTPTLLLSATPTQPALRTGRGEDGGNDHVSSTLRTLGA